MLLFDPTDFATAATMARNLTVALAKAAEQDAKPRVEIESNRFGADDLVC